MQQKLKIKICGMKYTANREAVEKLPVDWLGYIFYPQSKRFVGAEPERFLFDTEKPKVAVFVNENAFEIMALAKNFDFQLVQLHGKENPQTCQMLKNQGLKIIKAFGVDENFDFAQTQPFDGVVNYFLFDTKTTQHGGSGKKFDWSLLEKYDGHTPFFVSGGITPIDVDKILKIKHPKFTGIDLNSGFEDAPGMKNIKKIEEFLNELKNIDTQIK